MYRTVINKMKFIFWHLEIHKIHTSVNVQVDL